MKIATVGWDIDKQLFNRHPLVQMRKRIMNQLTALAMNEDKRWKHRLYRMWRNGWEYLQSVDFDSHAGQLVTGHSVK